MHADSWQESARETGDVAPTKHAYDAACKALWKHRERADKAEAELERLHSWGGLMSLLDEHWPTDIFPIPPGWDDAKSTTRRDTGPVILGLIRWVDKLSAEKRDGETTLAAVRDYAAAVAKGPHPPAAFGRKVLALLDGEGA